MRARERCREIFSSVRKLLWVGKKTERKLNEMGIRTIGDLAAFKTDLNDLCDARAVSVFSGMDYYRCRHCGYILPEEDAIISVMTLKQTYMSFSEMKA